MKRLIYTVLSVLFWVFATIVIVIFALMLLGVAVVGLIWIAGGVK